MHNSLAKTYHSDDNREPGQIPYHHISLSWCWEALSPDFPNHLKVLTEKINWRFLLKRLVENHPPPPPNNFFYNLKVRVEGGVVFLLFVYQHNFQFTEPIKCSILMKLNKAHGMIICFFFN